jgi:putative ABC transport system substrate-binding protein
VVAARDYFDGGHQAGLMAARVMRGERPADIPFQALESAHVMVNLDAARQLGIRIPDSVLSRATRVIGAAQNKQAAKQ